MFKEIGYVDELGSGVRNIHKYSRAYFGGEAELIESDIFKIIFKTQSTTEQVTLQVELSEKMISILGFCKVPRTRSEIQEFISINFKRYLHIFTLLEDLLNRKVDVVISDVIKDALKKSIVESVKYAKRA